MADEVFSGFDDNVGLMLSFFYKDLMGLEGASGRPSEQSGKHCVSQDFAKTTQAIEPPPAEPAEAAPGSWDNGARANDAPNASACALQG